MESKLPSQMRALQFKTTSGGLDKNVHVNSNASLPKQANSLPNNAVLVRVAYSSLNPADTKMLESIAGSMMSKPAVPGCDYAGTVVQSKLSSFKAGDRVFGFTKFGSFGALQEYIVVQGEDNAVKLPDEVSLSDAATLGVAGLTAYQSLKPYVKSGDRILIIGASGGVGTFQIQIAKALGCKITAVCSGANAQLCKNLGADEIIDYRSVNVIDTLKNDPVKYDYVCDNIFEDFDVYWQSHHYLKPNAKFVTIAGRPSLAFARVALAAKVIPGFLGGGKRKFELCICQANGKDFAALADMVAKGQVKTIVEQTLDLEQTGEGYTKIKSGRTKGKIVIKVAPQL